MAASVTPSKGSKPDKLMRDAIMLALKREAVGADGRPTIKLNKIADALVDLAAGGDMQAIKEVNDRVDGKAPQTIGGDPENPLFSVESLRELLGTKLDRIPIPGTAPEPQNVLN